MLTFSENSDGACDTGSDLKVIASEFPELDFSNVDPVYPNKADGTLYEFSRSGILGRGHKALRELYDRPEKVIAVVSHSAFLRTAICQKRFANADYRIFTFRRDNTKGELKLIEDAATAQKGGGMKRSEEVFTAIEEWDFPPENVDGVES